MNFSIGLTGINAASRAIELIGTNLANAATEGYHRQELKFSSLQLGGQGNMVSTGGVEIEDTLRGYDVLLEREHLRQQPIVGQARQEMTALTSIEAVLGQVEGDPISHSIQEFFGALGQLASDPNSLAYAQQTVWTADALANDLRSAAEFLSQMKDQTFRQAKSLIAEVNVRSEAVAKLNGEIDLSIRRGISANLLKDQRDQAITEMAELADVYVTNLVSEDGQIDVQAWGTPLVVSERYMPMEIGLARDELMGIGPEGQNALSTSARGGEIGGLMTLYNEIIPDLEDRLDTLAREVMLQINNHHVQGLGTTGSFQELDGVPVDYSSQLGDWEFPAIEDGAFSIRVHDPAGGFSVHDVEVFRTDTLDDLIDRINRSFALADTPVDSHIRATKGTIGNLKIECTTHGWTFDFVPDNAVAAAAKYELLNGRQTSNATDNYITAAAGGGTLDLTLGDDSGTGLPVTLNVALAAGDHTLDDVRDAINAAANTYSAGWAPASVEQDVTTGQYYLQVEAFETGDLADAKMVVASTDLTWFGTGYAVDEDLNGFSQSDGLDGLGGGAGGEPAPTITLDGIYDGENQDYTLTFRVDGGGEGQIGITENLALEIRNGDGEVVRTVQVGKGYAAGDREDVEHSLSMMLSTGTVSDGESFQIKARSDSDTSNFLVAAGMNTFFAGDAANNMRVRETFYDDAHRLATAVGPAGNDSMNTQRMASIADVRLDGLGFATVADYHRDFVSDIGQMAMVRQSRVEAAEAVATQLKNQRDAVSGVDPNEQAAQLIIFERMFQSMSKFISVQDESLESLMNML